MNLIIKKKDVIHINIKVRPNCDVILTAPFRTSEEHISYVLKKRENWINRKIEFYKICEAEASLPKTYVSGENFNYLGKRYRLKVKQDEKEIVKLYRGHLFLYVKDIDNFERKRKLLKDWYKNKAGIHFKNALDKFQLIINKEIKNVRIREMKTRWGSCNPKKSYINLNSELIKKPKECIEYVVFHELTHLIHKKHNKQFYNYLSTYMPDWKKRKEKLEQKT